MTGSRLEVENLSKTFSGQKVLDGVSVAFEPGQVHCLLGQNGSGKSTLIKVLSGYHAPDEGSTIRIADRSFSRFSAAESHRCGLRFVHQRRGIIGEMSALENMALGSGYSRGRSGRINWSEQERKTKQILDRVGRGGMDVRRPLKLARPIEQTAVAIARAIDHTSGPISYLFLDEPTASLPPSEVDQLCQLVAEVTAGGIGVVYVTHRLDEVFRIGDRVTVLRDGRGQPTSNVGELDKSRLISAIVTPSAAGAGQLRSVTVDSRTRVVLGNDDGRTVLSVKGLRGGIIDDLDLDVYPGEVVGFAGLHGSGREDVCQAVLGALPQTRARQVSVGGQVVSDHWNPSIARRCGVLLVPSNTSVGRGVGSMTIEEIVALPSLRRYSKAGRISSRRRRSEIGDWITAVGVVGVSKTHLSRSSYGTLSGGNQQKVLLARGLNGQPRVLVLDDPTAGVDVGARESVYELIRHFVRQGCSFVIASSDIQDLTAICSRVIVMRSGRAVAHLSGDEVSEQSILEVMT